MTSASNYSPAELLRTLPQDMLDKYPFLETWSQLAEDFDEFGNDESIADMGRKIAELEDILPMPADYGDYVNFFRDCYIRIGYSIPEVTSDYDKSVIFDMLEDGSFQ